jgi:hypothetical protein
MFSTLMATDWHLVSESDTGQLIPARMQLHRAVQAVAAVGNAYVPPEPDSGHLTAQWLSDPGLLASHATNTEPALRLGLDPQRLALELLDYRGTIVARIELEGRTMDDVYSWLEAALAEKLGAEQARPLGRPDAPVPSTGPGADEPFALDPSEPFAELARWYANADLLFSGLRETEGNTTAIRCWPHHFDIAFLVRLDPDDASEQARAIGVGMTPGDDAYAEPYWYVAPWPYPVDPELPALPSGSWHTAGWTGAVLEKCRMVGGDAAAQREQVEEFARAAIAACRKLLGG